jgi:ABC-type branched-subunit amino acid transport system ATPase component
LRGCRRFGGQAALIEAKLELPAGSTTAAVGPYGVEKSTVVSLVSGTRICGKFRDQRVRGVTVRRTIANG